MVSVRWRARHSRYLPGVAIRMVMMAWSRCSAVEATITFMMLPPHAMTLLPRMRGMLIMVDTPGRTTASTNGPWQNPGAHDSGD